ncbi:MAG: NUDIX domain-containing protein [Actinomycetia bacterium]|nr:NUDIX domain-containing protein [Actinomycetes bacterium]
MNEPMPIRPAATVVLLRDGADGLEVWLQQRATTLAFAAGMYVFPGGRVDEDEDISAVAHDVSGEAAVWGDDDLSVVRAHLAAAARETREESGVQLNPAALTPWARWVTPPGDTRRFDARFYLAACPPDQTPEPLTGEVAAGSWFVVRAAVDAVAMGTLPMWPPTISTLTSLASFDDVAVALAAVPTHIEAVTQ